MENPGDVTNPTGVVPSQDAAGGAVAGAGDVKPSGEPKLSKEMADLLSKDADAPAPDPSEVEGSVAIKLVVPERLQEHVPAEEIKAYEDAARQIAKRTGVKPEQAQEFLQGLANLNFDLVRARLDQVEKDNEQAVQDQVVAWRREIAADPLLGGHKYTATMALAEEGARRLGGNPAHVAFLRYIGGEEPFPVPLMVKMLHLAASTMREDRIKGLMMNRGPEKRSLEQALYGNKAGSPNR